MTNKMPPIESKNQKFMYARIILKTIIQPHVVAHVFKPSLNAVATVMPVLSFKFVDSICGLGSK